MTPTTYYRFELPPGVLIDGRAFLGDVDARSHRKVQDGISRQMINPISARRFKLHRLYLKAKRKYLREHPTCERCGTGKHISLHHIAPRSTHPELIADPSNFLALCLYKCHNWVHDNPRMARAQGYLTEGHGPNILKEAATRRASSRLGTSGS